jgi:hypothetical protein
MEEMPMRAAFQSYPGFDEIKAWLQLFVLTRFLYANLIHPRVKPEDMLRLKTL